MELSRKYLEFTESEATVFRIFVSSTFVFGFKFSCRSRQKLAKFHIRNSVQWKCTAKLTNRRILKKYARFYNHKYVINHSVIQQKSQKETLFETSDTNVFITYTLSNAGK